MNLNFLFKSQLVKITVVAFIMLSGFCIQTEAKTPSEEFTKYKALYPDEIAVYLNKSEEVTIKLINDSLAIEVLHKEEILHLKESSSYLSKDKIYSSHFSKISNISAKTLIPGKKKYQEFQVTEFKETNSTESFVFYDDSKFIEFIFPSVQVGAKTVLTYKETITDPHFLGNYFFQSFIPIDKNEYIVNVDDKIEIDFKRFHTSGFDLKYLKSNDGQGTTKHKFELERAKKLPFESEAPRINYFAPHINTMIASYIGPDGAKIMVLSSPQDLVNWYKTFIAGKENSSSPELASIVSEIINDSMTELEKVKAIYYWVQSNIKYIAFEDGMRGFIPHDGGYVCEKRYGDCKDMSSIIINMLNEAGISSRFTWIGSRDLPYSYEELPSPSSDNHMIASYLSEDGNVYFLDATSSYTPFGFPTSMIQGKDALIANESGDYQIIAAPIIPKEKNLILDEFEYQIEETGISGKGELKLSGYPKVFNTHRMIKADAKKTDQYITRLLNRGSNKFFVDNYSIENLENFDEPIKVSYDFRVEDYHSKVGNDIYININLNKSLEANYIEDRELPLENDYKYLNQSKSTFKLPEGYQIKYLPENSTFENELFGYTIEYKTSGDKIEISRSFYIDYLMLYPEDFSKWNDGLKKYNEANRQVLILTKS